MKKIITRLLMVCFSIFTLCISLSACSDGSEDEFQDVVKTRDLTNFLVGKKWTRDNVKSTSYKFFRNHMVMSESSGNVSSGMLTHDDGPFVGTWRINGDTLRTTFQYGPYQRTDDWDNILYGTLITQGVPKNANDQSISWNGKDGISHYFSYEWKNKFKDYTDESDRDGALHGTWKCTKYAIYHVECACYMTFNKDGSLHIWADNVDVDFNSTYTTKDGMVTLGAYLVPTNKNVKLLYVRESDGQIRFYSPSDTDGQDVWTRE